MINCKAGSKALSIEPDGKILPCCVASSHVRGSPSLADAYSDDFFTKEKWTKLRELGASLDHCSYCLEQEKTGSYSVREMINQSLGQTHENSLEYLNIFLSNVCNFQCRSCDSTRSYLIHADGNTSQRNINSAEFLKTVIEKHSMSLRIISFQGGEPLLYPGFHELLCHIHSRYPQIFIGIVTNLSVLPHWVLSQHHLFHRVKISVDGVQEAGEFIRKGLKWKSFISNLEKLTTDRELKRKIRFSYSLSAFSVFQANAVAQLAQDFGVHEIDVNTVINPPYLDLKNLNSHLKAFLLAKSFDRFEKEIKTRLQMKSEIDGKPLSDHLQTLNSSEIQLMRREFPELMANA